MRSETKSSWWREMGAISQGMLFIDGQITRTESRGAHAHGAQCGHRRDLHQRALKVLQTRRLREMTALSLFR